MSNEYACILITTLFVVGSSQAQSFKYWDVQNTASIPTLLSATGLYADILSVQKNLAADFFAYTVNTPLWSDGAITRRWVKVPIGKAIGFDRTSDYWTYPDSTVFIKQFAIDTIPSDSTSRILWETQILVNKKGLVDTTTQRWEDVWYAVTYKWDSDQREARLISYRQGLNDSLRIYPEGKDKPYKLMKWHFPSHIECEQCHRVGYADTVHGRSILGFYTAQLNRPYPENPSLNQLQNLFEKGVLTGTEPPNWQSSLLPRWASIQDQNVSVNIRARSYIAANCSGCHGRRGNLTGATTVNLDYDFHTMEAQMEFRYRPTATFGLDTLPPLFYSPTKDFIANPRHLPDLPIIPALVVPSYPEKSVLLFRQIRRNIVDTGSIRFDLDRNQMHPLGSYAVNVAATDLLTQWIQEMDPMGGSDGIGSTSENHGSLIAGPILEGRSLRFSPSWIGLSKLKVLLVGITGHIDDLQLISEGTYSLPPQLYPGVYFIRVDKKVFTRYLF